LKTLIALIVAAALFLATLAEVVLVATLVDLCLDPTQAITDLLEQAS